MNLNFTKLNIKCFDKYIYTLLKMKKKKVIIVFMFITAFYSGFGQSIQESEIPLAPKENRRPDNYKTFNYKYSLDELHQKFSETTMQKAANQYNKVIETNEKGKWKATGASIDSHKTPEWFEDAKFGMFIDWGLWSVAGWAKNKKDIAMYPDWYETWLDTDSATMAYHEKNWGKDFRRDDFIPLFKAEKYNPKQIVGIAKNAGMKYIVPFCKHHSGFCLWPSSFTQRDAVDMGPKRDLIKPMVEACKKDGIKFGFYFSIDEWEYPVIDKDGKLKKREWGGKIQPYEPSMEWKASGKIAVNDFFKDYITPQATEFIDKYSPDLIWYDGDWSTNVETTNCTHDIAAYLYNKSEGRKEVAINDRFGLERGKSLWLKRGDFYCSEFMQKDKEVKEGNHAWEKCRGISQSFGYNWQDTDDNVISSKKFIDMFVDIVSLGGNLLLVVNLDEKGVIPAVEVSRLNTIGSWLKVNGEGIYATRRFSTSSEGAVDYTQSKDGKYLYAIMKEWPDQVLKIKSATPIKGSKIELLGYSKPIDWEKSGDEVVINLPTDLQDERNRPCEHAWVLKMTIK